MSAAAATCGAENNNVIPAQAGIRSTDAEGSIGEAKDRFSPSVPVCAAPILGFRLRGNDTVGWCFALGVSA
jgi:hypothetical protein